MSDTESKGSFNWKNWIMGIVAAILVAIFTTIILPKVTGGEATPTAPPPPRIAEIKILNLPRVTLASATEEKSMQVEAFNEGNGAAESCQIQVNDEFGNRLTNSNFFGLVAGETEVIDVTLRPFDKSLELKAITLSLEVICIDSQSPTYDVVVSILP